MVTQLFQVTSALVVAAPAFWSGSPSPLIFFFFLNYTSEWGQHRFFFTDLSCLSFLEAEQGFGAFSFRWFPFETLFRGNSETSAGLDSDGCPGNDTQLRLA